MDSVRELPDERVAIKARIGCIRREKSFRDFVRFSRLTRQIEVEASNSYDKQFASSSSVLFVLVMMVLSVIITYQLNLGREDNEEMRGKKRIVMRKTTGEARRD